MTKIGRNYFAIIAEAHTPANTGGIVDLSPKYSAEKAELKSAIFIAPAVGVAGYLTVTIAGTYAVGDLVRVTITSNLIGRQQWRKSYVHTVVAGGTSVTAIATAIAALIAADVAPDSPYASATNVAGVITVTQAGDDKRGLVGYVYTDSALGTIVNVPTVTVYSEGQPSDLVDRGVDASDINLASYDTVRIALQVGAAIPFVDSIGATAREIYWFGTPGEGANLATLINTP
jgi:hypothetical protein